MIVKAGPLVAPSLLLGRGLTAEGYPQDDRWAGVLRGGGEPRSAAAVTRAAGPRIECRRYEPGDAAALREHLAPPRLSGTASCLIALRRSKPGDAAAQCERLVQPRLDLAGALRMLEFKRQVLAKEQLEGALGAARPGRAAGAVPGPRAARPHLNYTQRTAQL